MTAWLFRPTTSTAPRQLTAYVCPPMRRRGFETEEADSRLLELELLGDQVWHPAEFPVVRQECRSKAQSRGRDDGIRELQEVFAPQPDRQLFHLHIKLNHRYFSEEVSNFDCAGGLSNG